MIPLAEIPSTRYVALIGHQGFYPHAAIKTLVAALHPAAPTDEVGKS